MAKHLLRGRQDGYAVVLLAACVFCASSASAQNGSRTAIPLSLNSPAALKLLIKNDPPKYPPLARINYIQGHVRVQIFISRQGRVTEAHVLYGHPFLAVSALKAVREWVYRPYRAGLDAREFSTVVDFNFTLRVKKLEPFPATAEKDLQAQITPPEVVKQPGDSASAAHVRLRVLVDSEGHAIDARPVSGRPSDMEEAQRSVAQWTFRPARWGSLHVPWYLDVDVPVRNWPAQSPAGDPGGR